MESKGIIPENLPLEKDGLWGAVMRRDQRYYSRFVYGVRSTGIYCRPTCASRRPARENVTFLQNPAEAERLGFMPCKRCSPDKESEKTRRIQDLCEFITNNHREKLTLDLLSKRSNISPFHLQRTFKKIVGVTPREYIEEIRLQRLKLSLRSGESVRKSTYGAGYNTSAWLYFHPDEKLGMSPSNYKNGGKGLDIHYLIRDSPLGKLLVATTAKGICFVHLDDTESRLVSRLKSEYSKARIFDISSARMEDSTLRTSVEKILEYLSRGTDLEKFNLPLDLYATAFQKRVWKELCAIPYGQVRAYSEIARSVGRPKATRAVANACASNPVPIVIPCHRVVPKSGGVGQYGLGVKRKEILLQKEGVDLSKL